MDLYRFIFVKKSLEGLFRKGACLMAFLLVPSLAVTSEEATYSIEVPAEKKSLGQSHKEALGNMTRDTLFYMLGLFTRERLDPTQTHQEVSPAPPKSKLRLKASEVPLKHRAFILSLSQKKDYLEVYSALKRKLAEATPEGAYTLFHHQAIPPTLAEFKKLYPFEKGTQNFIDHSAVKGAPRRLSCLTTTDFSVSVAQTLVEGEVRETEVILKRKAPYRGFSFFAYGPGGQLTHRSTFQTSTGHHLTLAVPHTCLTCHYDSSQRAFGPGALTYAFVDDLDYDTSCLIELDSF